MKRSCHILVSLTLSALIVLLSVGISFVDCCHKQHALRSTIACQDGGSNGFGCDYGDGNSCGNGDNHAGSDSESTDNCCGDCPDDGRSDCGCAPQTSCVTVTVAKLAPFDDSIRTPFSFSCPIATLLWSFISCPSRPLAEAVTVAEKPGCNRNHGSPPRAILQRLCILRI